MWLYVFVVIVVNILHFFSFFFFRATLGAYAGSQARGPVGAVAAGLSHRHSNVGSEPHLQPTLQLRAALDP